MVDIPVSVISERPLVNTNHSGRKERNILVMMDIARVLRKPVNNPLPLGKVYSLDGSQALK